MLNCQTQARLVVARRGQHEFSYAVRVRLTERGAVPYCEASGRDGSHWRWSEGFGSPEARGWTVGEITLDEVARHALTLYAEERARR